MLIWQRFMPLPAISVLGLMLFASPVGQSWSATVWIVIGSVVAVAYGLFVFDGWRKSTVVLDDDGMTVRLPDGVQTWPFEKLIKVRQIGRYRVRMCWDPDIPNKHMHISLDMWNSDGFAEALVDWYAETTGHELPEAEEPHHEEQAAA